jgi:hypothetical protein
LSAKIFWLHCRRNKTSITPIGRCSWEGNSKSYVYWISQTRLRNIILELRHHDKTRMPWYITKVRPQDSSCVARYTHGCALLICIRVYDTKKNPGGRTGYPENHWNSFFVSPKCDKRMGLTGFPNSSSRRLNLK